MILWNDEEDYISYTCPICGSTCSVDGSIISCDGENCSFVCDADGEDLDSIDEPFDHDWSDD